MKPSVGLTVFTSSFINRLTIVVFPALSNPLCSISKAGWLNALRQFTYSINILISLSFNRDLRKIESIVPLILQLQWTQVALGVSEEILGMGSDSQFSSLVCHQCNS